MRVAFVTRYKPNALNGVFVAAAKLSARLVERGFDVEFWDFRRDSDSVTEREESTGVRVVELPFPALGGGVPLEYLRWMPRVSKRWVESRSRLVDGLHFHSVFEPQFWYLAEAAVAPYCMSPQGGYVMYLKPSLRNRVKSVLWHLYEKKVVERARFVHAGSEGDAASIRRLVPGAAVAVVPNGVDAPRWQPAPVAERAPFLYIGRFDIDKKGLDVLVAGYALALRRMDMPPLMIRGTDFRGGRAALDKLLQQHGLEDHVVVDGPVLGAEKEEILRSSALFVHPSRIEGQPLLILDALAAGRAVAVTPGTNLADVVDRAGAGFRIGAPTAEAVADALSAAAAAGSVELTARGRRARALAEREFSWDRMADTLGALYRAHFSARSAPASE